MPVTTLKIDGKEFVILPKKEYAALKAQTSGKVDGAAKHVTRRQSKQDAGDLAEIERRRKEPGKNIPWEQVKRELGL